MKSFCLFAISLVGLQLASAQRLDVPYISLEETEAYSTQKAAFNKALSPVVEEAAKSTVRLFSGNRRLAYGTVVGDGSQILSKWSEVLRAKAEIIAASYDDTGRACRVTRVYPDEDLAVLTVEGAPLPPIKWSKEPLKIGQFIASPQLDGQYPFFGVVSVLERNLRDTELSFLGIGGDPSYRGDGVKIKDVSEGSGAEAAGLKPDDIILKVGDRSISGQLELKNALTGVPPGSRVNLEVVTAGKTQTIEVLLGKRPKSDQYLGARLEQMERMGGAISSVRDSFSRAVQTDLRLNPNQVGGPVVDLKGHVVGVTLARADRTRSFFIPSAAAMKLLEQPGVTPDQALAPQVQNAQILPRMQRSVPQADQPKVDEEKLLQHLSNMQRLMDHLRAEMELLEP